MTFRYPRVLIVGVGLLGGSLGLALKARGIAQQVVGVGRRTASLDTARAMGAIDEASLDLAAACADSALAIVCTPAAQAQRDLDTLRAHLPADAIATDVASTKAALCAHAAATWPAPRRFVGSHPMAGSEKWGPEHAHADFYQDSVCLVEEAPGIDPQAARAIGDLWTALGARVVPIDPVQHDDMLARTSHVPHVAAAALAVVAGRGGDVRHLAGNGLRDTTRIAAGRPELWRDICLTNRDAVRAGLHEVRAWLDAFDRALADGDADTLERLLAEGAQARAQLDAPQA